MDDPYAILGVTPDTPRDEIKSAFRRQARKLHPDVNDAPDAEERFKELNSAWESIRDGTARASGGPHPGGGRGPGRAFLERFTDAVERAELRYFEVMLPRYFAAWRGAGGEVAARIATDLVGGELGAHALDATWFSTRRARWFAARIEVHIDYRHGWQRVMARRLHGRRAWRISLFPNVFWRGDHEALDADVEQILGEQLVSILAVEAGISNDLAVASPEDYVAAGRAGDDARVRQRRMDQAFWVGLALFASLIPFLAWVSTTYG